MMFFNVVIGYGIIVLVMIIDIDLLKEVIGWYLIFWLVVVSVLLLLFIWSNCCCYMLLCQLCILGQWVKNVLIVVLVGLIVWGFICLLELCQYDVECYLEVDMLSYGGVIVNFYLLLNWLLVLGLYVWVQVDEFLDNKLLINLVKKFIYVVLEGLDDIYVVFIIGEMICWDYMGIFGYSCNIMLELEKEKNFVVFCGYLCDIVIKLLLCCMFVCEGGVEDNLQWMFKEQNVFVVLYQLGFSGNLYVMQSEMWFYSNMMVNNIVYCEQIGVELCNCGKSVDDMLLVDEMKCGMVQGNVFGKYLIIFYIKGFYFNYI